MSNAAYAITVFIVALVLAFGVLHSESDPPARCSISYCAMQTGSGCMAWETYPLVCSDGGTP